MKKMLLNIKRFLQYGDLPTSYYVKRGMKVGENFNRQGGCKFDPSNCWLISIGNNVTLSNKVTVLAHDDSVRMFTGYRKIGVVEIGNNVFVGANTTILPNVKIGDNVIIGANSLVNKNIPDNSVAVGSPCKVISSTKEYVNKMKENIKTKKNYDINWTIYSKKKMSYEQKAKMFLELEDDFGFVKLGVYNDGKKKK